MTSSISVIIPAYNRANLIGETLRSLLNQTVPAKEIIVVDDGSTDSTAEVVESEFADFSRQFSGKGTLPELKVIKQKNAGPGAARNRGFAESTGEFLHFFDSDDIAAPNKHEVQLRALQESGADIAYGPWVHGFFNDGRFEPADLVIQQKGLPRGDLIKALLTNWSVAPHPCLFRRSIVERVRGFPENLFGAEDQLMFLRCLLAGAKVVHTPNTLELYRRENREKITASSEGRRRFRTDWGKFLVLANEEVGNQRLGAAVMRREWRVASNGQSSELSDLKSATGDRNSGPATRDSRPVTAAPSAWFGFRLRAWDAWEEIHRFGTPEATETADALRAIWRKSPGGLYRSVRFLQRKQAGFRLRLVGTRERSAARMGPLTQSQKELIEQSGYGLPSQP